MQFPLSFALSLLLSSASASTGLDEPFTSSYARLSHAPCVSLFHREGRQGCGTEDHDLQVGQLEYFDGSGLPNTDNKPYVAVMEEELLTAQSLDTLLAGRGGLLRGVLVLNSTSTDDQGKSAAFYSPDSATPSGYGTPSANINNIGNNAYNWNPKGQDLFAYDMHGIPMAYVLDSQVAQSLRQEAQADSDKGSSAIVAEFNYYMGPQDMNSKECLAWKDAATDEWNPKCLPLAGTSVWAAAGSPPNPNNNNNNNNGKRPAVILAAAMDSTSMFHDITPGANTAASNILTILMAAKLIGQNVNDQVLDNLPSQIVLALFEGESYGFVGSRAFLRDVAYPGFQCDGNLVYAVPRLGEKSEWACLSPLRPSIRFNSIGKIKGMISVDQVGHLVGDGLMYAHADDNNDNMGSFMANVLKYSSTNDVNVASASNNNNNAYPYPPSPLTSLLQLSGGNVGGAVLTGYDYAFTNKVPYHSHRDDANLAAISLDSIAAAATILARSILAAAYDDGSYDYQTAAQYAANLIGEMNSNDQDLVDLANCLLYNGECSMIKDYSSVEVANDRVKTGANIGSPNSLGNPPNYYVGVYNRFYGQPFVSVGDNYYGAYNGEDYGKKNSDAIHMLPEALETALRGLFNDFLGRGSNEGGDFASCKSDSNCANVEYCDAYGDRATCTGRGECVCSRAQYHVALDDAIQPAENKPAGYFVVDEDNDQGVSAMYTEPYWSNSVGVRVYRDAGWLPGFLTLAGGLGAAALSLFSAFVLRVGLKKEKLY